MEGLRRAKRHWKVMEKETTADNNSTHNNDYIPNNKSNNSNAISNDSRQQPDMVELKSDIKELKIAMQQIVVNSVSLNGKNNNPAWLEGTQNPKLCF